MAMSYYRGLLTQERRIEAFRRAIQSVVRPNDRVLEVGTGLGTFAFFAADAGAARVWAVEGDPVVHVAETIGRLNGYGGKVEFMRGWVPDVELPERATVLIFEDFAPRLLGTGTFRLLSVLHERYLERGARTIPARARLMLAPVGLAPATPGVATLGGESDTAYGIDWTPSRDYVVNEPLRESLAADVLVAEPVAVGEIFFGVPPDVGALCGKGRWTLDRDVVLHGLAYWFDLELAEGEWLSNAPGSLPGSWGQLLLPLDPPLSVAAGRDVRAVVRPERGRGGAPGWLCWRVGAGRAEVRGHEFASGPASFADLYEESPDARPRLSERGRLEAKVLQLTDGSRTISDITTEIRQQNPGLDGFDAERLVVSSLAGRVEARTLSELCRKEGR